MVWTPPVNIPSFEHDYSRELYSMLSGLGDDFRQNRRDRIGDEQWDKSYAADLAAQQFSQADSNRQYALELRKFEADQAADAAGADERFGTLIYEQDENGNIIAKQLRKTGDPVALPGDNLVFPAAPLDVGGRIIDRDRYGRPIGPPIPKTGDVATDFTPVEIDPVTGDPAAVAPRPGSKPAQDAAAAQRERTANQTKAQSALFSIENQGQFVEAKIDEAIENIGPWTTGWGGLLTGIPESNARALARDLDTIRANLGLGEIQELKSAGATLGQVTIFENLMLQAVNGALDQLERGEDMRGTLQEIKRLRRATVAAARIGYMVDFEGMDPADAQSAFKALVGGADPAAVLREIEETYGGGG